jgi:hypothetical protein
MEMIAFITGDGDGPSDAAIQALLDDFLPSDSLVVIPDQEAYSGCLATVIKWMEFCDQEFVRISGNLIHAALSQEPVEEYVLIVIGTEGNEEVIKDAIESGWDVFDLTRGMFPVWRQDLETSAPEMPLSGAEDAAESLAGRDGLSVRPVPAGAQIEPEGRTGVSRTWTEEEIRKLVEECMTGYVRVQEMKPAPVPVFTEGFSAGIFPDSRSRYLRSADGIRKAPRAQPKPGEEEVWLTDAEADCN